MVEYHIQHYYVLLMTVNVTLTLVVMLGACLCCKKKSPKNDLLGLEGMVKLKNPDDIIIKLNVVDSGETTLANQSIAETEKRTSSAPHRSLPDIPVTDSTSLYETLKDALPNLPNDEHSSRISIVKKQSSISQHSSISQADDISSPYSRVKSSMHDYAKVLNAEHPYAQINLPSSGDIQLLDQEIENGDAVNPVRVPSSNDLQVENSISTPQIDIPAASAIAGMVSASQDLPYMTPPIATLHFSGDSQDSSKGYTSISVREPIANILVHRPVQPSQIKPKLSCEASDSHYATVSDDSDETYAAIEDSTTRVNVNVTTDTYTSGSETYAQIQPLGQNSFVVAVEINSSSNIQSSRVQDPDCRSADLGAAHLSNVDNLRAQLHSRQASSSSNNSTSLGNLGSPKPEKRQANSPLPPTPKSNNSPAYQFLECKSPSVASGRNSDISVVDMVSLHESEFKENSRENSGLVKEAHLQNKSNDLSPSKDIEVMYAKVVKKNKASRNAVSPNDSPIEIRRQKTDDLESRSIEPKDVNTSHKFQANVSSRNSDEVMNISNVMDHGYETIPPIENNKLCENQVTNKSIGEMETSKKMCLGGEVSSSSLTALDYHCQAESESSSKNKSNLISEPHCSQYETLQNHRLSESYQIKELDSDPNYEELTATRTNDDGYAKIVSQKLDLEDGYSKVKLYKSKETMGLSCYTDNNHNYESIAEPKALAESDVRVQFSGRDVDHYSNINETHGSKENMCKMKPKHNTEIISDSSSSSQISTNVKLEISNVILRTSNMAEKPEATDQQDPNYESLYYSAKSENQYERLDQISVTSKETLVSHDDNSGMVHDYFQV